MELCMINKAHGHEEEKIIPKKVLCHLLLSPCITFYENLIFSNKQKLKISCNLEYTD